MKSETSFHNPPEYPRAYIIWYFIYPSTGTPASVPPATKAATPANTP